MITYVRLARLHNTESSTFWGNFRTRQHLEYWRFPPGTTEAWTAEKESKQQIAAGRVTQADRTYTEHSETRSERKETSRATSVGDKTSVCLARFLWYQNWLDSAKCASTRVKTEKCRQPVNLQIATDALQEIAQHADSAWTNIYLCH